MFYSAVKANIKKSDYFAFVACNLIGYYVVWELGQQGYDLHILDGIGCLLITYIAYHLFLLWLFLTSDKENNNAYGPLTTAFYHMVFFLAAAMLSVVSLMLHGRVGLITRTAIVPFAFFEKEWLFSARKRLTPEEEAPHSAVLSEITAEEHALWMEYMQQQPRPFPRSGRTVPQEFARWRKKYGRKALQSQ